MHLKEMERFHMEITINKAFGQDRCTSEVVINDKNKTVFIMIRANSGENIEKQMSEALAKVRDHEFKS